MNNLPSKEMVERIRSQYPIGTRVALIKMRDPYSRLKPGAKGVVSCVDDIGTIHISWDCGSLLGMVLGVDSCQVLLEEKT